MQQKKIVFFDGICLLCNKLVLFLLKMDKKRQLSFSPLQGETFRQLIPQKKPTLDSLVFYRQQKVYHRSEAVIRILVTVSPPLKFLLLFLWIPQIIRDIPYRMIAHTRYRIFGKYDECVIPDENMKERFLP
ncbi:MAG: DCC1-like thiol-disulfide oxidoreductase family protein [Halobacteriovoraceae bacterium]|nr:DCC1-like thiol-disulfide oxidoreductase family protein [Halobacteriovoraceae bacterium]